MRTAAILALAGLLGLGGAASSPAQSMGRGGARTAAPIGNNIGVNIPASRFSLPRTAVCCNRFGQPFNRPIQVRRNSLLLRRQFAARRFPFFSPLIAVPVPYYSDFYDSGIDPLPDAAQVAEMEAGAGYQGYADPRYGTHYLDGRELTPRPAPDPAPAAQDPPQKPQPMTVLIFRDGHKVEVQSYAIGGATLYNLSDRGPLRISLEGLDVDATVKANEERGVAFHMPAHS